MKIDNDTKKETLDNIQQVAQGQFKANLKIAKSVMDTMSAKGMRRAIMNALTFKVDNTKLKFQNVAETQLAGMLAKLMDLRVILQGSLLQDMLDSLEEENSNNKNEKEEQNEGEDL